jgi:hypothetical protein
VCRLAISLTLAAALTVVACSGGGEGPQLANLPTTVAPTQPTTARSDFSLGDRVETRSHYFVTVMSYVDGFRSSDQFISPSQGNQWSAVEVVHCAGDAAHYQEPSGTGPQLLSLQMRDNTRRDPEFVGVKQPALTDVQFSGPGDCARGWVTFQVPVGQRPAFILVSLVDDQNRPYVIRWRL